ncbi:hypothetical protein HF324_11750 [Chitinophaga oryzae]|uniref:Uncharacterized protein n=1 Tax=Chitinophaga oryzae TaxID=2725414 RepID=A0ABX6LEI5_9BACT|nr:hypothetical protein [Chitinophaga oryzae]QJB38499.1 hypothetical protein HF324_11750 [Chitinophaga oryzae]
MKKKLSKLNAKKVEAPAVIKGGLLQMVSDTSGGDCYFTTAFCTQRGDQFSCDHKTDC